jgi:plastocyanin
MRTLIGACAAVLLGALAFGPALSAQYQGDGRDDDRGKNILALDDCDPRDVNWNEIGGCFRRRGEITRAEFFAALASPLSIAVVGHTAWAFGPSYLKLGAGGTLRVTNVGGRDHTFTEVAQFGGGNVPNPALNKGLTMAPECAASVIVRPGGKAVVEGLAPGDHKFQCCIHPWMRAQVEVLP